MLSLLLALSAQASDLHFGLVSPEAGSGPAFAVTPSRPVAKLWVDCELGGASLGFEHEGVGAGESARFPLPRDESVTEARCTVIADFADSAREEVVVPLSWSYGSSVAVELDGASADVEKGTLTVNVNVPVVRADIVAYGAHKRVLDELTAPVRGGPGQVVIPWVGKASEVVLLEVKLHAEDGAWAGFSYSPWFLDLPHEDVHFPTGSHAIPPEEEPKLEATLARLEEVMAQYGEVVPVKLYIAGCTDTVGEASANRELSRQRARAIGSWLRSHGFSAPIYYHGFGEELLAVPTGENVDEARNRRAIYMVGANPPPAGSGIPAVDWRKL